MMELKAGYKQTEVGIIPEDWNIIELKHLILKLNSGVSVNSVENSDQYAHEQAVLKTSCIFGGYFYSEESKKIIPKDISRAKLNPSKDSIIISRMNTPVLVGECGYIDNDYSYLFLPDRLWQTTFKKDIELNVRWLAYILSFGYVNKAIKDTATGTSDSMKNIAQGGFLSVKVPLPPTKAEQTAIATALSDTNALISSLEKLIVKKRNIKQGAMQTLLQPKEDWEVKKLGDCFTITAGGDLDTEHFSLIQDEKYCYPIYSNALTNKGLYGYTSEYRQVENTITVTARGQVGVANPRNHKYSAIGRVIILNPIIELNINFITECINNFIGFNSESTGVPQLTAPQISKYEITIPDCAEQTQIATILSDMDTEITALETKLAKIKAIKLGMMQELLTGKTRLI